MSQQDRESQGSSESRSTPVGALITSPEGIAEASEAGAPEDTTSDKAITQQTDKDGPPAYDADANQTYKFELEGRGKYKGKKYPVLITFGPVKDGDYIAYDKQRDVRLAGESDGIATSNETFTASVWLGRKRLLSVEGWGKQDGSNFSDDRLADVVQNALLACDIEPRGESIIGDASSDNPWEEDDATEETIRLRCIAHGKLIVTAHTPGAIEHDELARLRKRYNRLKTRGKLVEGDRISRMDSKLPSRAEQKGEIYDDMGFVATGYSGRVPLRHKEKVVDEFFEVEQELVAGK